MGGWKRKRLEALNDDDLTDVYLVGTDGEEIACSKWTLAAQSPVFKSMFFKGFREQQVDRCKLEFHSMAIKVVVKYCYCGELDINAVYMRYPRSLEDGAALVAEVREAGRYFELEELRLEAEREIGAAVFQKSSRSRSSYVYACFCACFYLTELFKRGEHHGPLWSALFEFAIENADGCFGNKNNHGHPPAFMLAKVLEKVKDTVIVVKCLQAWFARESKKGGGSSDEEKQALVDLSKTVDLKELSADQLSLLFKFKGSCDLFPSERILEAFFHNSPSQQIQRPMPKRVDRFYVSGAGMDCLNGFYSLLEGEGKMSIFSKSGQYDGQDCLFIIHYTSAQRKWLVSITTTNSGILGVELDDYGNADPDYIKLDAYEATDDSDDSVPFNSWKCLKGADDPVPIVARINE